MAFIDVVDALTPTYGWRLGDASGDSAVAHVGGVDLAKDCGGATACQPTWGESGLLPEDAGSSAFFTADGTVTRLKGQVTERVGVGTIMIAVKAPADTERDNTGTVFTTLRATDPNIDRMVSMRWTATGAWACHGRDDVGIGFVSPDLWVPVEGQVDLIFLTSDATNGLLLYRRNPITGTVELEAVIMDASGIDAVTGMRWNTVSMGFSGSGSVFWEGWVQEFFLYPSVLATTDMQSIANAGFGGNGGGNGDNRMTGGAIRKPPR